jgi:hypothetical protein
VNGASFGHTHRFGFGQLANLAAVKMVRRALVAIGLASVVAAVLRLRGSGGVPPQSGGWRELSGPELR